MKNIIIVLSLSASKESVSRECASYLAQIDPECFLFDIRELKPIWMDNRPIDEFPEDYKNLIRKVKISQGVIFAFPIYNYSSSSIAKFINELLGEALHNKPVAFIYSSGTVRSHLAISDLLLSLLFEHKIYIFPDFVNVFKSKEKNELHNIQVKAV